MAAAEDPSAMKAEQPRRRAALHFILILAALDMLAMGVIIPVLPGLIKQLVNGDSALAARYVGWIAALWGAMVFVGSPLVGALSDRFGRRPVLLASMFGAAADFFVMALAPTVALLFVGRAISGLTSASFSTANAYIADITPEAERASRFALLNATFGIGMMLGPVLGGLLGQVDPRLPFWVAGGLSLANGIFGVIVLPESLKPELRAPFSPRLANPVAAVALYRSRPGLLGLAGVMFLYYLSQQVLWSAGIPYVSFRYHWSTGMMGLAFMLVGVSAVVVQIGLVRPFVARFGERRAVLAGLLGGGVGLFIYGAAPTGPLFLMGIFAYALVGLQGPALQALMNQRIGPTERGRLQGANGSVVSVASVAGPILFTEILARALLPASPWPLGAPFYLAAAMLVLAMLIAASNSAAVSSTSSRTD